MSFAKRVLYLRRAADLTLEELAAACGVSTATVGHWETGRSTSATPAAAQSLARVTGASLEWILFGTGTKPSARRVRRAASSAA